jgi:hypothetical protein
MSIFKEALLKKHPEMGDRSAAAISNALEEMADRLYGLTKENNSPEERVILSLLSAGSIKNGLKGVEAARKEIEKLLQGKPADLSFADLKTESDALVLLQKAEAARKQRLVVVSEIACNLIVGSLGGLLKALTKI